MTENEKNCEKKNDLLVRLDFQPGREKKRAKHSKLRNNGILSGGED